MLVRLALLWLSMTVPATVAVAIGGPVGLLPHVLFHPLYIAMLVVLAVQVRRRVALRSARVLALIVAITSGIAIAGQLGEEVVVLLHGGMTAPDHLLEEPDHLGWAVVGMLGGLFPSNFLVSALSIVIGVSLLRRRDRRGWAALAPGFPYVIGFGLALVGVTIGALGLTGLAGSILLVIVAFATSNRPTQIDRSVAPLPRREPSAIPTP